MHFIGNYCKIEPIFNQGVVCVQLQVPRSVCNEPCQPGSRKVSYQGQPFCCYDCIRCMEGEYSNNTGENYYFSTEMQNQK